MPAAREPDSRQSQEGAGTGRYERGAAQGLRRTELEHCSQRGHQLPWQPRSLRDKSTVCLSYQVLLPSDFDFSQGGAFPGILGQADQSGDGFLVRLAWQQGGSISATNFSTLDGKKYKQQAGGDGYAIPRGRWVKIDQEVILNAPDQENGILRVWVDGSLAIDKADLAYRTKQDTTLAGVAADIFYNGDDATAAHPRTPGFCCRLLRSAAVTVARQPPWTLFGR